MHAYSYYIHHRLKVWFYGVVSRSSKGRLGVSMTGGGVYTNNVSLVLYRSMGAFTLKVLQFQETFKTFPDSVLWSSAAVPNSFEVQFLESQFRGLTERKRYNLAIFIVFTF